jgi:prepilin-type N-terminal cleavage/methylation domain-containing protein
MLRLRGKDSRGFTMIEIIAVLLILGFLAFTAVSMLYQPDTVEVPARLETLKSNLRFAQAAALNSSNVWGIEWDDNRTYALFKMNDDGTSTRVRLPGESATTVTLPSGVSASMTVGGAGISVVSFTTWGVPCTTKSMSPTAAADNIIITLTQSSESKSATMIKNTGYMQ